MNGNSALLDSNIIIDASKGIIDFQEIIDQYDYLYMSVISYIEVLGYNFPNSIEKNLTKGITDIIPIIFIDKNIADIAIDYRIKGKIKLPDALILATAKSIKSD